MAKKAEQKKLYIAYGSNLNLPQMAVRCPTATVKGSGEIKGYELLFRGVATVEPKEGGSVPVHLYRKEMMDVEMEGKTVSAMVYVMNDGRSLSLPSERYYGVIEEGYKTAGFPTAVLEQALARTLEKMDQEESQWRQLSMKEAPGFHL